MAGDTIARDTDARAVCTLDPSGHADRHHICPRVVAFCARIGSVVPSDPLRVYLHRSWIPCSPIGSWCTPDPLGGMAQVQPNRCGLCMTTAYHQLCNSQGRAFPIAPFRLDPYPQGSKSTR